MGGGWTRNPQFGEDLLWQTRVEKVAWRIAGGARRGCAAPGGRNSAATLHRENINNAAERRFQDRAGQHLICKVASTKQMQPAVKTFVDARSVLDASTVPSAI